MITIEVVQEYIKTNIIPIKDCELLLLRDIVRDIKTTNTPYLDFPKQRGLHKEIDSVVIMELLDYQIDINPERLLKLDDKKRLLIKSNKKSRVYKQRF